MTESSVKWYETLSPSDRDSLFSEMRKLGESADRDYERYKRLAPKNGEIAVGGEHFAAFLDAESKHCFLRYLRSGSNPQEAHDKACVDAKEMVQKWNDKVEWQRRWSLGAAEPKLLNLLIQFSKIGKLSNS